MAGLRLIKRRIKTVDNISQITRAMEMVAALKMRRAQEQALKSRPYLEKAKQVLTNLIKSAKENSHPLLQPSKAIKEKTAILIIAPNRGLCGSLITNLFRQIFETLPEKDFTLLTLGKRAKDFVKIGGFPLLADFPAFEPPRYEEAIDIAKVLKEEFLSGNISRVFCIYSHFHSTFEQEPLVKQLLPLSIDSTTSSSEEKRDYRFEYLFEPSADKLMESFLPHILEMKIYQMIIEAFASEQSARMVSMRNATENAEEIKNEMTLTYNKERQQIITGEISDIVTAQLGLEAK